MMNYDDNTLIPTGVLTHFINVVERYLSDDEKENKAILHANIKHDIDVICDYINADQDISRRLLNDLKEFKHSESGQSLLGIAQLLNSIKGEI